MLRLPSGLPPLPLVGNLLDIGMGKGIGLGPQPHVRMTTLAEQYGDVMALRMGGAEPEPWVVLSSPAAVHDAFVARGGDFSGRPDGEQHGGEFGRRSGLCSADDDQTFAELRPRLSTLFGAAAVGQAEMKLEAESQRLAQHLLRLQATSGASRAAPGPAPLRDQYGLHVCLLFARRLRDRGRGGAFDGGAGGGSSPDA